jgi:hypothetical protein
MNIFLVGFQFSLSFNLLPYLCMWLIGKSSQTTLESYMTGTGPTTKFWCSLQQPSWFLHSKSPQPPQTIISVIGVLRGALSWNSPDEDQFRPTLNR